MFGKNPLLVPVIVLSAITALTVIVSVSYISELQFTIDNQNQKVSQISSVDEDFKEYQQWATSEITKYQEYSNQLKSSLDELDGEKNSLQQENERISELVAYWQNRANEAEGQQTQTLEQVLNLADLAAKEASKPRTSIENQIINWYFSDSKGNQYSWTMPVDTYENLVAVPPFYNFQNLQISSTGESVKIIDYTDFVGTSFSKVIDDVYKNSNNEDDFMYEVWYIVSKLTTYSTDINYDNPRYALETFSRGGGDCEDTSILIADMLKSSSHSKNWKIQLLYFDADHPQDPQTVNHLVVTVDTGQNYYVIESTAKEDGFGVWAGQKITGWYFDV